MASKEKFKLARAKAEKKILEFINDWGDKTGYNINAYKEMFKKMSDSEFYLWMEKIRDGKAYLHFEINGRDKPIPIDFIEAVGKKWGVMLREYVMMPYRSSDPNKPMVTKTRVPILKLTVRRLQQMAEKKNSIAGDNSSINPITGQVTGNSKSAKWSNSQTYSAATTNMVNVNKEFLGPRADDEVSKREMIDRIEKYGKVSMSDLTLLPHNKQTLKTVDSFLTAAGLDTDIASDRRI